MDAGKCADATGGELESLRGDESRADVKDRGNAMLVGEGLGSDDEDE